MKAALRGLTVDGGENAPEIDEDGESPAARSSAVSRGFDCVPRTWITLGLNCKRDDDDDVVVRDDRTIGLGEARLPPQLSPRPSDMALTSSRSQKNDVPARDG